MLFHEALQILDSIVSGVAMTRAQHVSAQQAIQTIERERTELMDKIEELGKKDNGPKHRE